MEGDFIKEFWNSQGKKHKESHWASWGDYHMLNLEIDLISGFIDAQDSVLDVGCANGYSVFEQLKRNPAIGITGVDFSEEMIRSAQVSLDQMDRLKEKCSFKIGDIRNLDFHSASFEDRKSVV